MNVKIAALVAVFVLSLVFAGCTQQAGTGRVLFTIADKAADLGAVSSINVTVDSVSVQSAAGGWVTVSSTPKTYDLLALKASGNKAVLADVQLGSGNYTQVRLQISRVVVVDATGAHEAKLPSSELKIVGGFKVAANSTAAVTFDFVADESLHVTGNGTYILAPVVKFEAREGVEVEVKSEAEVKVSGGRIGSQADVGMDEKGDVKANFRIPADAAVSVSDSGIIGVVKSGEGIANVTGKGRIIVGIGDKAANMSAVTSVSVTVESISVQSAEEGWVTVSSTPKTYDLMQLQGKLALAADANISTGTYEQVRLNISKVVVVDANGSHEATLPSGELKIVGRFEVKENATSTISFDFLVNESLHLTGNGTYILAPVVKFESRENAQVDAGDKSDVKIGGGEVRDSVKVGMDENGDVGEGRKLSAESEVGIENGKIKIGVGIGVQEG